VRLIDKLTLVASGGGIVGGGAALWMGLRHNPQGEFFVGDTGRLDLRYCGMVFGAWFAVAGFATLLVALAVTAVLRARARRA
jgi:hypothetical protein